MSKSGVSQVQNKSGSSGTWVCNLAEALLPPANADQITLPNRYLQPRFVELGLPALKDIPLSPQLVSGHPLREFIQKERHLGLEDLERIFKHPSLHLALVGFDSGAITAAACESLMEAQPVGAQDYVRNMWARDSMIMAAALNRTGVPEKAHQIVRKLWECAGSEPLRNKFTQYHLVDPEIGAQRYRETNDGPHVKLTVDRNGNVVPCDHEWGHQQIDALGAMIWAPYRFANQAAKSPSSMPAFDLTTLDPVQGAHVKDSILPIAIKMLRGIKVHDQLDFGPWEDIRGWRRATSVGIVLAALNEARTYHDREGWDRLAAEYGHKRDGEAFRTELMDTLYKCLNTVQSRIPENGFATECDQRPCDSAMTLLLYPFDCNLKMERQNTILRTVYHNMGTTGFRRWDHDCAEGHDLYVGQDYFYNSDPSDKGEFAKKCEGFKAAEWTLFDPLLAAYYYRRFIKSGGGDREAFAYGDRHLKRSLSFLTKETHLLDVAGKGRRYEIPAGILPEAFAWDSRREEWRPNHNSPLLMAQAALGLAFERAREACRLSRATSPVLYQPHRNL